MRLNKFILALIVTLIALSTVASYSWARVPEEETAKADRETVLDRAVHIEKNLITEIPQVPRWCDRLKLKKRRVNIGDCELYVEEEGKGIPLVLINGGPGGTHHYFHPWFSKAKKYARVIYYDQRGCGLSDFKPGPGYTVEQAVEDLEKLRQALNVQKWIVLGYSYGGFLAQYYTIHHPEDVAGLVLMSASTGMSVMMKPTRQYDYLSEEEKAKLQDIRKELSKYAADNKISRERAMEILLYNNFINGDWKRQNFYRPSPKRMAQVALYEWKNDGNFNNIMNQSKGKVDLTGAFENCPIPTLIMEGKWDLTWNTDKPEILLKNHPGAKMVMFERSSHHIYSEEPDKFFQVLKEFIRNLQKASAAEISAYKDYLVRWDREKKSSPDYILRSTGYGRASNEKLVKAYARDWTEKFDHPQPLLKIGMALYDLENYQEALYAFEKMQAAAQSLKNRLYEGVARIWQGHMLDV